MSRALNASYAPLSSSSRSSAIEPGGRARDLVGFDHSVGEPILNGLLRSEEAVALHVLVHALEVLARVLGVDLVHAPAQVQHLLRMDLDVGRLALEPAGR